MAGASENQHQMTVIKWGQQASVRGKYPELKLLFHVPNERICSPQQGRMMKLLGVRSGVPDLCLPIPRGGYHGLWIEMKAEGGKPTENQRWWGSQLAAQGYRWEVCIGWEAAAQVLEEYLGGGTASG